MAHNTLPPFRFPRQVYLVMATERNGTGVYREVSRSTSRLDAERTMREWRFAGYLAYVRVGEQRW